MVVVATVAMVVVEAVVVTRVMVVVTAAVMKMLPGLMALLTAVKWTLMAFIVMEMLFPSQQ